MLRAVDGGRSDRSARAGFKLWIGGVEQTTDGKLAKGDVAVTS